MPTNNVKPNKVTAWTLCELFPSDNPDDFATPEDMDRYEARWERMIKPLNLLTNNGIQALLFSFLKQAEEDPHEFTHILSFAESLVANGDETDTFYKFNTRIGQYKPSVIRATHATKPGCWLVFHRTKEMLDHMQVSRATLNRRLVDGKPHTGPNAAPLIFTMEDPKPLLAHRDAVWTKAQIREQLTYTHEELGLE